MNRLEELLGGDGEGLDFSPVYVEVSYPQGQYLVRVLRTEDASLIMEQRGRVMQFFHPDGAALLTLDKRDMMPEEAVIHFTIDSEWGAGMAETVLDTLYDLIAFLNSEFRQDKKDH